MVVQQKCNVTGMGNASPRFLCRPTTFFLLLEPWDSSKKKMSSDGRGISDQGNAYFPRFTYVLESVISTCISYKNKETNKQQNKNNLCLILFFVRRVLADEVKLPIEMKSDTLYVISLEMSYIYPVLKGSGFVKGEASAEPFNKTTAL